MASDNPRAVIAGWPELARAAPAARPDPRVKVLYPPACSARPYRYAREQPASDGSRGAQHPLPRFEQSSATKDGSPSDPPAPSVT